MYCKYCGKSLKKDTQFCIHCGQTIAESIIEPHKKSKTTSTNASRLSRKNIFLGIIAGLVLTAVCSPLVLFSRSQALKTLLNPENRAGAVENTRENLPATSPSPPGENSQATSQEDTASTRTELEYPNIPMVFASDRDDPDFNECSQTGSCWTQVFYTPSALSGSPVNLTMPLGFGSASHPSLSPDGTKVAFTGFMPGGNANHIYVVNIDGSGLKKVSQDSYTHMYSSWAPDSSQLVYMSKPDTGTFYNLYTVDITSSQIRQITSGNYMDRFPSWSPDGKYVAFHTNREDPDPATCWPNCLLVIYVINAETSEGGPAQDDGTLVSGGAIDWSPDGSQLAFHSDRDGSWNIYLMQKDGSVSQLTDNPGDELFPSWSPDGNYIAYSSETAEGSQIAVTPADHFEPIYFESQANRDIQPDW